MADVCYFFEERIPEELRALVRNKLIKNKLEFTECTYSQTKEEIISELKSSSTVLFAPGRYLDDDIMRSASHLKLMQIWSSGYDKFNLEGARKYGITVANNGGANAISVSEHTIMLMLAASRKMIEMNFRASTGNWKGNSHGMDMFCLHGKKLGIIGLGNIGNQVAIRADAMGMEIQYADVDDKSTIAERYQGKKVSLQELFCSSDYITIHCHHNEKTSRMVTRELLASTKKGVIFINVSRSQLVEIEALYELACKGHIAGIGLDVYEEEPTSGFEPLVGLPNVISTPHTAGSTIDTYKQAIDRCIDNIKRAIDGEKVAWKVSD